MKTRISALVLVCAAACGGSKSKAPVAVAKPTPVPAPSPTPAPTPTPIPTPPPVESIQSTLDAVGLDPSALDKSVDPCTDFYQFACGGWLAKTEIPADKSSWFRSFSEIDERNTADLKGILEAAQSDKTGDPVMKKIGAFYGACMDMPTRNKLGAKPIAGLEKVIAKVKDPASLAAAVMQLHRQKIWVLFDIIPTLDFKDATHMIADIGQDGLGLPDRDNYLADDENSKKMREAYSAYIEDVLTLDGVKPAAAKQAAVDIMALETDLAKVSKTRVELRDPVTLYNKLDRTGLIKSAPAFPWDAYFKGINHPAVQDITVDAPKFIEGMAALLGTVKPEVWRMYLRVHLIRSYGGRLSDPYINANFKLRQALTGQKELEPMWKRCSRATDDAMGELLGQAFVKLRFSGDSKDKAEAMVLGISAAFAANLGKLDWMDQPTREKAMEKLKKMAYHIGYPAKWKQYDFTVDKKNNGKNALAAEAWSFDFDLAKIGKPVDKDDWQMTPPTVNAYYDPTYNQMMFPAGILQPPFFNAAFADQVNFGGIGMVEGHELTHGFDDQGAQFDADGNLVNWWSDAVAKRFKAKTQCVVDQYSKYEVLPGLKLNGELTQGENIADIGGVKLSYSAFKAARAMNKSKPVLADGFTEEQQFFLAFAQAWCGKVRDPLAKMLTTTDPHSNAHSRVNGPLSDTKAFAEAFQCKVGSAMRPANACEVW